MVKRFAIFSGLFLTLFCVCNVASAHVLKTDGSIGAVMHIDPDDSPIAGKPATFFFEIKDKQGKFSGAHCNCTAGILENGKQLYSGPLFKNGGNIDLGTPVFSFTFPVRDVYTVKISGSPTSDGSFQAFSLQYDIRVDRQDQTSSFPANTGTSDHTFHVWLFGGGFLLILVLYLRERRKNPDGKKNKTSSSVKILLAGVALTGFFIHAASLDTALCFHDHPVFAHHECCATPQMTLAAITEVQVIKTTVALEVKKQSSFFERFNVGVHNKSPPVIVI